MIEGFVVGLIVGAGIMYLVMVCLVIVPLGERYDELNDYLSRLTRDDEQKS